MLSDSPLCKRLSRYPAASRAAAESGGVLISPCSHASGLSVGLTNAVYVISDISTSSGGAPPNHCMHARQCQTQRANCNVFVDHVLGGPDWRANVEPCHRGLPFPLCSLSCSDRREVYWSAWAGSRGPYARPDLRRSWTCSPMPSTTSRSIHPCFPLRNAPGHLARNSPNYAFGSPEA